MDVRKRVMYATALANQALLRFLTKSMPTVWIKPATVSSTLHCGCRGESFVFGSDVCNVFAEAPPPKQGFYICPDQAFNEWWENYKGNPLIPHGHVITVLLAMQGHPESPRLLEKHADAIL